VAPPAQDPPERVPVKTVAAQWGRIGCIGFGGPPAHIVLLRRLCVEERHWLPADEFEDAMAACNLLPGPASTQLAIFCAWRVGGVPGAVAGAAGFILPGLLVILGFAALFLQHHPPRAVAGAAAGAAAVVAAVAVQAAGRLLPSSWKRMGERRAERARFVAYAAAGAAGAVFAGRFLVLVLLACGGLELAARRRPRAEGRRPMPHAGVVLLAVHAAAAGGLGALVWVAFQVGALSYGGGFVIVPLMQHQVVSVYHFMTGTQFLDAVALGQVTPGPVVQTVAVVGYAAAGVGGGLLASAVAFAPSLAFIVVGAPRFDRLRGSHDVQSFLTGAGPAAIGAIAGSAVPLGLAIAHLWQLGLLGLAAIWLLALRRSVVTAVVGAGVAGAVLAAAVAGLPVGG
jgi:chromate transporter